MTTAAPGNRRPWGRAGLSGSKIDPWKPAIDQMIAEDDGRVPRSVRVIYETLITCHGMPEGGLSAVENYVSHRRRVLREARRAA